MADPNKAKVIAGIKARSIKKYGKGRMQRTANLEATYQRLTAKPTRIQKTGVANQRTGAGMGRPRVPQTSVPRPGNPNRNPVPITGRGGTGSAGQRPQLPVNPPGMGPKRPTQTSVPKPGRPTAGVTTQPKPGRPQPGYGAGAGSPWGQMAAGQAVATAKKPKIPKRRAS